MNHSEHYEEFYQIATDSYDLDAYAEAVTLDQLGMYTPAYEALVRGDLAVMEAYNDLHATTTETTGRAAKWLARFGERAVITLFVVSQSALWIIGIAAIAA